MLFRSPMFSDGSLSTNSLHVISVSNGFAQRILDSGDVNLGDLQTSLDTGEVSMGFQIEGVTLGATVDILRIKSRGRNVVARLNAGDTPGNQVIVIGAHIDHLGKGQIGRAHV